LLKKKGKKGHKGRGGREGEKKEKKKGKEGERQGGSEPLSVVTLSPFRRKAGKEWQKAGRRKKRKKKRKRGRGEKGKRKDRVAYTLDPAGRKERKKKKEGGSTLPGAVAHSSS